MPYTSTPRTWVAGEVPTATHFNDNLRDFARGFTDAWTSYTPTLTASTTNPTNWTQTGYYMQVGKLVIAKFDLLAGASMTPGSGFYRVALPVAANVGGIAQFPGGQVLLSGTSTAGWTALAWVAASTYAELVYAAGTAVTVAHNAPWTWANTHRIRGQITYEAA